MVDNPVPSQKGPQQRQTRITILVDNNVLPGMGLIPEHGFSCLVERNDYRFLFDTGRLPALEHNARVLGVDLYGLHLVVLSHGHYDHTGGLLHVAHLNPGLRVIAHPAALSSHLTLADRSHPREIGIPHTRESLEETHTVFDTTPEFTEILDGVWFTGEVPRRVVQRGDERLAQKYGDQFIQDIIPDDASLLIETAAGPILLLGCAHAGIRNIMEHVREKLGIEQIYAVIGGTHLGMLEKSATAAAIKALEEFHVQIVAPTHCTGPGPSEVLRHHFGERFRAACAGTVFEFPA